jgi:hypothetical protein
MTEYNLWWHPKSDCYFYLPQGEGPEDLLCEEVTGWAIHELAAKSQGVIHPRVLKSQQE